MERTFIILILIVAFFISFYDFIFTSSAYANDSNNTNTHYSGGDGFYGYSSGSNSVRGSSSNSWHRGFGSRGK